MEMCAKVSDAAPQVQAFIDILTASSEFQVFVVYRCTRPPATRYACYARYARAPSSTHMRARGHALTHTHTHTHTHTQLFLSIL
jgi:hypothetical protein